jgi:hypothetical protein
MPKDKKSRLQPPPSLGSAEYAVGYCKPPAASQFQPGQSGNPQGRPKGARNKKPAFNEERLEKIIIDEAYRMIKVNEGKRQVSIPMAQAIIRSVAVNAARGHHRSQQLFAELLSETERSNAQTSNEWLKTAIDYKCYWEQELARRAALKITAPEPLPHPDDLVIDLNTGQVIIKGPMTKEEKLVWDWMRARLDECVRKIDELTAMLNDPKNKPLWPRIEEDIAQEKSRRDLIIKAIGEPRDRGR